MRTISLDKKTATKTTDIDNNALIVRCKNGAFWLETYISERVGYVRECAHLGLYSQEDFYCAYGERRSDDE